MSDENSQGSAPATWLDWIGLAAAGAVVLGPLLGWIRLIPADLAFRIFLIGGILAVVTGLSALVQAARGKGFAFGRTAALLAGMIFIIMGGPSAGGPMTNDFTSNLDDPPEFEHALTLPANQGRDFSFTDEYAAAQRESYPDLAPMELSLPVPKAFELALSTARAMPSWSIVWEDPSSGRIEAVAETRVFGFRDDIAIRVRSDGSGSLLDIRSKSRDGKGDLGANNARIRAYFAAVEREK